MRPWVVTSERLLRPTACVRIQAACSGGGPIHRLRAHRALIAAFLGWMLDAFDVMLYALVLAALIADLGIDKATAGLLGSLTLLASAARRHHLRRHRRPLRPHARADGQRPSSIPCSPPRAASRRPCGSSRSSASSSASAWAANGRAAPRWCRRRGPPEHRGKALGLMQSAWAIGYAAAAGHRRGAAASGVARRVLRRRAPGALHALGPPQRRGAGHLARDAARAAATQRGSVARHLRAAALPLTVALTLMNACTLFAWWGFNLWIPAYLSLPSAQGGIGLSAARCRG